MKLNAIQNFPFFICDLVENGQSREKKKIYYTIEVNVAATQELGKLSTKILKL